jgi:hypothetical protein
MVDLVAVERPEHPHASRTVNREGEHRDARPHQGGDERFVAAASGPL